MTTHVAAIPDTITRSAANLSFNLIVLSTPAELLSSTTCFRTR
jgi:hypothetical protein